MKHARQLPFITAIGGICAFFLILIFPSLSGAQEEECANIDGTWDGSETGTVTCTVAEETETEPVNVSGIVTIEQNGCDITTTSTPFPGVDLIRTGTIKKNNIGVSGPFYIPLEGEVSLTQNTFTAEGTVKRRVEGRKIKLKGSGIAEGTAEGEGGSFPFSCTANTTNVLTSQDTCGVAITNATVTRAARSRIEAAVTPGTFRPHHIEWVFAGGRGGTKSGRRPFTIVTMVDGDNSYTVEVKVFSDVTTVACTDTAPIVINPRTGARWELAPTLRADNERRFGDLPTCQSAFLGEERDRRSNTPAIIIPSPLSGRRWEDGYRVSQVRDPGGPNDGYFYIRRARANIDQETVINRWIKPNGPRPERGQDNWFTHNDQFCVVDPAAFLQAVKSHEDSGSGPGSTGHYGLIRDTEAIPGNDARTLIEDNFSAASRDSLIMDTNDELQAIEDTLQSAAAESKVHGNWPGDPDVSFWDPVVGMYSDCVCFNRAL